MRSRLLFSVSLGLLLGFFTFPLQADAQVPVRVGAVEKQVVQHRHAVTGTLRPVAQGQVAAIESGKVVEVLFREGQEVKQGDLIARIDSRRLELQRREAEADRDAAIAELDREKALLKKARIDLERARQLVPQRAVSQSELDASQAAFEVAEANILATNRKIDRLAETIRLLQVRLDDTAVYAPYDASVVERLVEPGDWLSPGEPILSLVSTGPIEAVLDVPERFLQDIEKYGDKISVRARALQGDLTVLSVRRIAQVNPRVRTLRVIATLENPNDLLTSGMSVDAWIALSDHVETTTIPKDAVIWRQQQPVVYRVRQDQQTTTAEAVHVNVLFETEQRVAIGSSQLTLQDRVIVEGNERLQRGDAVSVVQPLPHENEIAATRNPH